MQTLPWVSVGFICCGRQLGIRIETIRSDQILSALAARACRLRLGALQPGTHWADSCTQRSRQLGAQPLTTYLFTRGPMARNWPAATHPRKQQRSGAGGGREAGRRKERAARAARVGGRGSITQQLHGE